MHDKNLERTDYFHSYDKKKFEALLHKKRVKIHVHWEGDTYVRVLPKKCKHPLKKVFIGKETTLSCEHCINLPIKWRKESVIIDVDLISSKGKQSGTRIKQHHNPTNKKPYSYSVFAFLNDWVIGELAEMLTHYAHGNKVDGISRPPKDVKK